MTIHYPDIYSGQAGMGFAGTPVVMVKATESTGYVNPDYQNARKRASQSNTYFGAYHFLTQGNGAAQADHAFSVVGPSVPLMLDFEAEEAISSHPTMQDALAFIDKYRSHGGICFLNYFPQWYWVELGRPDCSGLISRNMVTVASDYVNYSDSGPGWNPYGGLFPGVWQYTAGARFNGFSPVDFNAYRGTAQQWIAMANGLVTMGSQGPNTKLVQDLLNALSASLVDDGVCGADTTSAIEAFQKELGLTQDGIVGPTSIQALQKGSKSATPTPNPTPDPKTGPTTQKAGLNKMIHIQVEAPDGHSWTGKRTFFYSIGQPPQHIVDQQTEDAAAKVMPLMPVTWNQYQAWGGQ